MCHNEIFLKNAIIDTIIKVSFGTRSTKIYMDKISDNMKRDLKLYLKASLIELIDEIINNDNKGDYPISDKIEELSNTVTQKHENILYHNRFRIGISQKIINLLLKYYWSMGKINTPPHCPYDGIIKAYACGADYRDIVNGNNLPNWTDLDDINAYKDTMKILTQIAKRDVFDSLAKWELQKFNNLNYNAVQI